MLNGFDMLAIHSNRPTVRASSSKDNRHFRVNRVGTFSFGFQRSTRFLILLNVQLNWSATGFFPIQTTTTLVQVCLEDIKSKLGLFRLFFRTSWHAYRKPRGKEIDQVSLSESGSTPRKRSKRPIFSILVEGRDPCFGSRAK